MLKMLFPLVLMVTIPLAAEQLKENLLVKKGDFELGITANYAVEGQKTDVLDNSLGFGLTASYHFLDAWSINLKYKNFSDVDTSIVNQEPLNIHRYLMNVHYSFLGGESQTPYLIGGLGYAVYEGENTESTFHEDGSIYNLGLGYRYQVTEKMSILAESIYHNNFKNNNTGAILTLGTNYHF